MHCQTESMHAYMRACNEGFLSALKVFCQHCQAESVAVEVGTHLLGGEEGQESKAS